MAEEVYDSSYFWWPTCVTSPSRWHLFTALSRSFAETHREAENLGHRRCMFHLRSDKVPHCLVSAQTVQMSFLWSTECFMFVLLVGDFSV